MEAISPTDFILGTKVQPNKAHSLTQVPIRSRSKVKVKFSEKLVKKQRTGHISEAISPTDFILGTKVQPNKAHQITQVSMTLTQGKGQGQIFPKMGINQRTCHISVAISPTDFIFGT